jgi:hypothetical protein
MRAYVGHLADEPELQFLVLGDDFQTALDAVDMLAQPDESSLRPVTGPFFLRVALSAYGNRLNMGNAPVDPLPVSCPDLEALRANPGTGPTGDTLRSYGPTCEDCGFQHFEGQECKAFLEPEDDLPTPIVLYARRHAPAQGFIGINLDPAALSEIGADFVEVCDLADFDLMAVFPFAWEGGRYVPMERAEACIEGGEYELLAACRRAKIAVPQVVED